MRYHKDRMNRQVGLAALATALDFGHRVVWTNLFRISTYVTLASTKPQFSDIQHAQKNGKRRTGSLT